MSVRQFVSGFATIISDAVFGYLSIRTVSEPIKTKVSQKRSHLNYFYKMFMQY